MILYIIIKSHFTLIFYAAFYKSFIFKLLIFLASIFFNYSNGIYDKGIYAAYLHKLTKSDAENPYNFLLIYSKSFLLISIFYNFKIFYKITCLDFISGEPMYIFF